MNASKNHGPAYIKINMNPTWAQPIFIISWALSSHLNGAEGSFDYSSSNSINFRCYKQN